MKNAHQRRLAEIFPFEPSNRSQNYNFKGTHYEPIVRAVRECGIVAGFIQRHTILEQEPPHVRGKNRLYIIGDDLATAEGPEAFHTPTIKWVLKDASSVILHLCAAEPLHYGLAAAAALMHKKVILVETQISEESNWKNTIDLSAPTANTFVIQSGSERLH